MGVIWYLALAIGATALSWKGSTLLDDSSDRLAAHYGLPEVVQGAVVSAVGSSFPELASVVLAVLLHGEFQLGIGAIVGSAIFNVLVIPALSGHSVTDRIEANRALVYKEALFYMLAVSVSVAVFSFARIYHPVPDQPLYGTLTRPLALIPLGLYGLYAFTQYQDSMDHTTPRQVTSNPGRMWLTLVVSLGLILVAIEGLIRAAVGFGALFDTPSFLWGLTVVAVGTSLPDLVLSLRATRDGKSVTSLANALGSNTFALLVAIPAGVLLAGDTVVFFGAAVPLLGFLTFATIVLFTVLRTGMSLSNGESTALLGVYAAFVGWMVAEAVGAVNLVPGI